MTKTDTDAFAQALAAQGYAGTAALQVTDFSGHVLYSHQPERPFPAASTIKVPLLIYALQQSQAGDLNLAARVELQAADQVPGAGVLHELGPGLTLTWRDLLTLMIIVSDNTATNLVIERLGQDSFNAWLTQNGLHSTHLVGKLQLPVHLRNEAQRRGERNRTSAADQTRLLLGLVQGRWLNKTHTALALDILGRQQLRDLIGRGVPADAAGLPLYRVASKSGELVGIHHDVGVLYTPRPLVIALLSEGGEDLREHPDNRDVGRLSRALWQMLGDGLEPILQQGQAGPLPGDI